MGGNLLTSDEAIVGRLTEHTDVRDGTAHVKKLRVTYDFAVLGGVISAITLGGFADKIPDNATVLGGIIDVLTTLTTAGGDAGTIAISVESADDVVAAIAVSDGANPWDEGLQDVIPVRTKATSFKLTAERSIVATIAGQVVTAGKFEVTLEYVEERAAAL